MQVFGRYIGCLVLALFIACASSADLTKDAQQAMAGQNYALAVKKLLQALDKDQTNITARELLRDAAAQYYTEETSLITSLAASDVIAAADQTLAMQKQLRKIANEHVEVTPDPEYSDQEADILNGAAERLMRRAENAHEQNEHKQAYRHLKKAEIYAPEHPDLGPALKNAHRLAVNRIAFLPWRNGTDLPELTRALLDEFRRAYRNNPRRLEDEFIEIVPFDVIYRALPLAALESLSMAEAFAIAEEVGANTIVIGKFDNVKLSQAEFLNTETIYQRIEYLDVDGRVVGREYNTVPMSINRQERQIALEYTVEIIHVSTQKILKRTGGDLHAGDAVNTTNVEIVGDPERDYTLYDPTLADPGNQLRRELRLDWQRTYPETSLTRLLTVARAEYDRKFAPHSPWALLDVSDDLALDEAPVLALKAMQSVWDPVVRIIRQLRSMK